MAHSYSHIDPQGRPTMVNVGNKKMSKRMARARAVVYLPQIVWQKLGESNDWQSDKGPVGQTAVLAGIMAAKKTGDLIPLCHPLPLEDCRITIQSKPGGELIIECTASITAKTGVEMEALTGVTIAALTVYDMCKALSHEIVIKEIRLIEKHGGKREFLYNEPK